MDSELGVAAPHAEGGARGEAGQGPLDEDVGAPVEAEVVKVDSRAQR